LIDVLCSLHPINSEDPSRTMEILILEIMSWRQGPRLPEAYQWPDLHVLDGELVLAAARPEGNRQILILNTAYLKDRDWLQGYVVMKVNNVSNSVELYEKFKGK